MEVISGYRVGWDGSQLKCGLVWDGSHLNGFVTDWMLKYDLKFKKKKETKNCSLTLLHCTLCKTLH